MMSIPVGLTDSRILIALSTVRISTMRENVHPILTHGSKLGVAPRPGAHCLGERGRDRSGQNLEGPGHDRACGTNRACGRRDATTGLRRREDRRGGLGGACDAPRFALVRRPE